jgi:hypothetical protein
MRLRLHAKYAGKGCVIVDNFIRYFNKSSARNMNNYVLNKIGAVQHNRQSILNTVEPFSIAQAEEAIST